MSKNLLLFVSPNDVHLRVFRGGGHLEVILIRLTIMGPAFYNAHLTILTCNPPLW